MIKSPMKDIDLAALLVSRVCHDLISPVGAVINGLEVMEDDDDPGMREEALKLIGRSAAQASAKLQFARLAFGASGSRGDVVPVGDVREAAAKLFEDGKAKLNWQAPDVAMPKAQVKALANLVALGNECLPRGGTVSVMVEAGTKGSELVVRAQGPSARLAEEMRVALAGETAVDKVDGRAVVPLMLGLVARQQGGRLVTEAKPDEVLLSLSFPKAANS
jgi:histidine phosphotransferase ChpT